MKLEGKVAFDEGVTLADPAQCKQQAAKMCAFRAESEVCSETISMMVAAIVKLACF
jgi:hypothetical protein